LFFLQKIEPTNGMRASKRRAVRSVFDEKVPGMAPSAHGGGSQGANTMLATEEVGSSPTVG